MLDYTFKENTPISIWETPDTSLEGFLPLINQDLYVIQQDKGNKSNNLYSIFKYYWSINKKHHVYSSIGNVFLNQKFTSFDKQILSDGTEHGFTSSGFNNNLEFGLNDLFLGVNYKFRTGIFIFNQGISFHQYFWFTEQFSTKKHQKFVALPNFETKIEFDNAKKLDFNYELKTSFSNISKLADRYYLLSYNSVYKGNENLSNELFHQVNLRYSKFSLYKGLRFYMRANYEKKIKGLIESVIYQDVNQYVSPLLLDNAETKWSLNANLKKKIKNINFTAALNYSGFKYLQQTDQSINTNKNTTIRGQFSAKTSFNNFPVIELGYVQKFGFYTLSNTKAEFVTMEPFLNIDYDFCKGFIFSLNYNLFNYKDKTFNQNNTYDLANTSLYYRNVNSAWSFSLEVNNVFGVQYKNENMFNSYIISDSKTYILPRIIMFSIGYNL